MSKSGTKLARLMTARSLGVRELARMVPCNPGHIRPIPATSPDDVAKVIG